ncbi:hypothetical protein MNBD_GAMMA03-723 [hydrothermal vent metagenome]|uniref:Uncharacterized protein n=1 Tax=hydrothermal vent metagenome TaxID=652676 RepID=A0A3B0W1V3_9ZZZZ
MGWVSLVTRFKFLLPKEDLADCSVLLACSMLTYCLIITFSFLANNPNELSTQLLIKPEFIYTCTLYVATLVAFDIAGS